MSNHEFLSNRLRQMQQDINIRLDNLIKIKYYESSPTFDDLEQRITDCITAIDRLEASIKFLTKRPPAKAGGFAPGAED